MAGTKVVRLLLVRSGQTQWDLASRVQGRTSLPLAPEGRDEAAAGLRGFEGAGLSGVLCGPDEGSVTTAGVVSGVCGGAVRAVEGLADMDVGLWEGMLHSELEDRYPRACRLWRESPACVCAPEGESLAEVQERVLGALARPLARVRNGGALAVVLRPVALGVVRCWAHGAGLTDLWTMVTERPSAEWCEVTMEQLRAGLEPLAAG